MMHTHIFFDLGFTLIDESFAVQARVERTAERLRGTPQACSLEEFTAMMRRAARENAHPYASVMERLGVAWREPFPKELERPYPGAKPLLESLRGRFRLGVIANQSEGTQRRLREWGLAHYFDVIVSSAEEGLEKPDPRIFHLALERAGCAPEQAIMVGDRLDNDIVPAKRLGMKTIWIRQGWGGVPEPKSVEETPDIQVCDLEKLRKILNPPLTEL